MLLAPPSQLQGRQIACLTQRVLAREVRAEYRARHAGREAVEGAWLACARRVGMRARDSCEAQRYRCSCHPLLGCTAPRHSKWHQTTQPHPLHLNTAASTRLASSSNPARTLGAISGKGWRGASHAMTPSAFSRAPPSQLQRPQMDCFTQRMLALEVCWPRRTGRGLRGSRRRLAGFARPVGLRARRSREALKR
jgi:hypothetical protein